MINNRYIIKKKLGEGRSKVFLCLDADNPEKEYAIKILPEKAGAEEIKVFRKEFFTLQNLNHPHIIASHEEGTIVKTDNEEGINSGSRFIILDLFLGTELLNYNKLKDEQTLELILKQICSVLYYLHQSNYIYYDLKPENILVLESEGKPFVKLIDMGFAHHLSSPGDYTVRGTREYIAPEILKNEQHNHQVDLYSLGIMLYKIIYGKFPFTSVSEIEIYKEHIERDFEFPVSNYSETLIEVTKKLLQKNPVNRFDNSLQILKNINAEVDQDIIKHFIPAHIFADRIEVVEKVKKILNENKNKEVIILSGSEGSGKTTLLYKIYSDYEKVILISGSGGKNGISYIQFLLKKIIFQEFIYPFLSKELIEQAVIIISGNSDNLIANLKSIVTGISSEIKFNIFIDDFNLLDEFTLNIFNEILPIFQVNGTNIILSERTDHQGMAAKIINKAITINLSPFSENDLNEYLDNAFATFFPRDQLKKLIIRYADLLPGSIVTFISDLIFLKILKLTSEGAEIIEGAVTETLVESSQDEIFRLRFALLSPDEIKTIHFLSAFENMPEISILSGFHKVTGQEIYKIFNNLVEKNILKVSAIENTVSFTSDSLKKYAYSTIDEKKDYHLKIAGFISDNFVDFSRNELARQFELGEKFISCYEILLKEIDVADRLSAFSYKKNILNHLLTLPLPEENKTELRLKQSSTFYKLNDAKTALSIIEDSLSKTINENIKDEFLILKGSCLIELGEFAEGKAILSRLRKKLKDEKRKRKILIEIAYAEFDLGKYEISEDYAKRIIENEHTSLEEKAKCHNLLGLIEIYLRNNLENALKEFEKSLEYYKEVNAVLEEAKLERNIGNIYNMKGEHKSAEEFWDSAHKKNLSIGNLDQEAKHLLNYGIYHYELAAFDEAVKQYNQALEIFSVLGSRLGEGLALINLSEVNIDKCIYQEAYDSLLKAREIFSSLNKIDEEAEVLFLSGKLFSAVGAVDGLVKIIDKYKEKILDGSERHKNNIKYLEFLGENNQDVEIISEIKDKYLELNDITNFVKVNIFYCESLIGNKKFIEAFDIINKEEFLQVCSKNIIIRAYREFLIGEIAEKYDQINIPNPLNNYIACYEILKDTFITELTGRVMLKLGQIYFERGNYSKAKEYIVYTRKLFHFIAERITDTGLRESYLMHKKRAFEKLQFLEEELSQ